jgi:cytosine deaminase
MLLLRHVRLPVGLIPRGLALAAVDPLEPTVACDVLVAGATISRVAPVGQIRPESATDRMVDFGGALVFPAFVDAHVHLDKAFSSRRAPNRSGTMLEAREALARDRNNWTPEDLHRRAEFALRCAWARGTRAIRTHLDTRQPTAARLYAVLANLREAWKDRIVVQTVPGRAEADYSGAEGEAAADLALAHGAVALGGTLGMAADLDRRIDRLMAIARERGLGLDLHVDENGDPGSQVLLAVAKAVERNAFAGPVVCGHACSLSLQPPELQHQTIERVRASRIGVVALPLSNLYLQDRRAAGFPQTPRWRGITLVRDLIGAGVPVACASDNVRDAYCAYGDFDLLEVYVQSVRLAQLEGCLQDSVRLVTAAAAEMIGVPNFGSIVPGSPARLVVFKRRSLNELLSRPDGIRKLVDGEEVHSAEPPEYEELG